MYNTDIFRDEIFDSDYHLIIPVPNEYSVGIDYQKLVVIKYDDDIDYHKLFKNVNGGDDEVWFYTSLFTFCEIENQSELLKITPIENIILKNAFTHLTKYDNTTTTYIENFVEYLQNDNIESKEYIWEEHFFEEKSIKVLRNEIVVNSYIKIQKFFRIIFYKILYKKELMILRLEPKNLFDKEFGHYRRSLLNINESYWTKICTCN